MHIWYRATQAGQVVRALKQHNLEPTLSEALKREGYRQLLMVKLQGDVEAVGPASGMRVQADVLLVALEYALRLNEAKLRGEEWL
ncbi:MAG TPA: hypothetical protein VEY30_05005 [Myxococcaceae bacterium]|nr:hypothetical protein [Myxococcaceae bacterium]